MIRGFWARTAPIIILHESIVESFFFGGGGGVKLPAMITYITNPKFGPKIRNGM